MNALVISYYFLIKNKKEKRNFHFSYSYIYVALRLYYYNKTDRHCSKTMQLWRVQKGNEWCISSSSDKFSQDNLLLGFRNFRAQIYAFMPNVRLWALNLSDLMFIIRCRVLSS